MLDLRTLFNVSDLTAVITGGSGQLGRTMAHALAQAGVQVAIVSLHAETSGTVAEAIQASGGRALGIACDVLDRVALERTLEQVTSTFGPVDILINAAGGNQPQATTTDDRTFFDLDMQAVNRVFGLNFSGTFQCCQVFGRSMAARGQGCIVNVASMNALRPLTRIPASGGFSRHTALVGESCLGVCHRHSSTCRWRLLVLQRRVIVKGVTDGNRWIISGTSTVDRG
jgi:NAD(P)-dependent dehydrogenase (short-subunit alcohol dehydrogenase family)